MGSYGHSYSWAKGVFVLIVFALGGVTLAAGGLGLAPIASLGGLGALAFAALDRFKAGHFSIPSPGAIVLVGVTLLGWAAVTMLWSETDRPANLVRTISGGVFYTGFFLLCLTLDGRGRRLATAGVLLCVIGAAAFFLFELVTSGVLTAGHRAPAPDQTQVWRNLGHGLSAWMLMLPAALLVLPLAWRPSIALGAGLILVAAAAGIGFGLTSNVLGLIAAGIGGMAAWRWPRRTIVAIGGLTAVLIIVAPAFGLIASIVPDSVRAIIPDSWELRLEAWSYATARIAERPLAGWGFDASRAMSETIEFAGAEVRVLPLHPHNAGLHLWLETGVIGAALAAVLVVLVTRAIVRAPGLTRLQAVAAAAAAAGYVAMSQVSYGVWQEWWVAAIGWAAAAAALVGPALQRGPEAPGASGTLPGATP